MRSRSWAQSSGLETGWCDSGIGLNHQAHQVISSSRKVSTPKEGSPLERECTSTPRSTVLTSMATAQSTPGMSGPSQETCMQEEFPGLPSGRPCSEVFFSPVPSLSTAPVPWLKRTS